MTHQLKNNTIENPWNPFVPTKKDIARTDELASKNAALAGTLSFFFIPVGLLYLYRGINALKILGYVFAVSFMFGLVADPEEDSKSFTNFIALIGTGAITAEQVMAVNKARQRSQEKHSSFSVDSSEKNDRTFPGSETNQEAVGLLKQIKEKYAANEISEEEFKVQKQRIIESL